MYGVYDELGNLKQVQPDFVICGKNLDIVAIADAKTAISGEIPFDDQAKNLIRLAATETTTKKLIYYMPEWISPKVSKDFMNYVSSKKVKLHFVVVK